jgi:threonine synthase
MVTDDEILEAYRMLASQGGIFGEPASAASFAGLLKRVRGGMDLSGKRVVCVITGSGLKDPDTAMLDAGDFLKLPADIAAVEKGLGWS